MSEPVLLTETRGRVRHLTLNRPDVRNALNHELNDALVDAVMEADHDPEVYAIAITGAGKAFCSGADLGRRPGRGRTAARPGSARCTTASAACSR